MRPAASRLVTGCHRFVATARLDGGKGRSGTRSRRASPRLRGRRVQRSRLNADSLASAGAHGDERRAISIVQYVVLRKRLGRVLGVASRRPSARRQLTPPWRRSGSTGTTPIPSRIAPRMRLTKCTRWCSKSRGRRGCWDRAAKPPTPASTTSCGRSSRRTSRRASRRGPPERRGGAVVQEVQPRQGKRGVGDSQRVNHRDCNECSTARDTRFARQNIVSSIT